jgi:ABC-type xylose transport system permease subunit
MRFLHRLVYGLALIVCVLIGLLIGNWAVYWLSGY